MDVNLTVRIRYSNVRLALALIWAADRLPFLTPETHGHIRHWIAAHVVRVTVL